MVLEADKLAYANKTKESNTSQKLGSRHFRGIANSVLNKDKSAIPPLLNGPQVLLSSASVEQNIAKNVSRNCNLDDSGIFLPVFTSKTNPKLHNILVTLKMVTKVITNLDLPVPSWS